MVKRDLEFHLSVTLYLEVLDTYLVAIFGEFINNDQSIGGFKF